VPVEENLPATTDEAWAQPLSGGREHSLYTTYSLIIATMLGTMGLPHILVRFYTNPDGSAARRTTLAVLALLGLFYLGPTLFGALGRIYTPDLLMTGRVDSVVLELPSRMIGGVGGDLISALVTAGAFAAFLSTAAGLTMSAAAVLSQDVFRSGAVRTFQLAAVPAALIPFLFALSAGGLAVGDAVSLAFAVAASTFCPLLVLGIWWRRLTPRGAFVGMTVGLLSSAGVMGTSLVLRPEPGLTALLLGQPALWSVPLAFLTMVLVSLADDPPPGAESTMLRLHLDETRTP
jgi:Na+(H+)/acetate symporter ActP